MNGALLLNRTWRRYPRQFDKPLKDFKRSHHSVVYASYFDHADEDGSWEGFFVQKVGKRYHAIWFGQLSEYPDGLYCSTAEHVMASSDTLYGAINGFFKTLNKDDEESQ